MKLTKTKLKEIIREELNEATISSSVAKTLSFEIVDQLYLDKHIKVRNRAAQELIFNILTGRN